jgi:GNAT superfamily N-acetyltransferase
MASDSLPKSTYRPATLADADVLHALTQRSTMHWGYEPEFLEWEPESIAVTPAFLETAVTWILEADGIPIGYYALVPTPDALHLDKLFVEPGHIGTGCGKRLWNHAIDTARGMGADTLVFLADPNAGPFYRAMGAELVREIETTRPGWNLLEFRVSLASV